MEDSKNDTCASKSPTHFFHWNIELVAEAARAVAQNYKNADIWSGDLSCEKQIILRFMKEKQITQKMDGVILSQTMQTAIVDISKLNDLIEFLTNYKDPQV